MSDALWRLWERATSPEMYSTSAAPSWRSFLAHLTILQFWNVGKVAIQAFAKAPRIICKALCSSGLRQLDHTFSAFWLWSSVVSVLISVTTDMSPTGDLLVACIFHGKSNLWACSRCSARCASIAHCWLRRTLLGNAILIHVMSMIFFFTTTMIGLPLPSSSSPSASSSS